MAKVMYEGYVIAESNDTVKVEGNHYFPIESIDAKRLEDSDLKTTCPWKGEAHYYHLNVDGNKLKDAVWYYPQPSEEAKSIKNRVAFYQKDGLQVVE